MLGANYGSVWTPKTDRTEVFHTALWRPTFDVGGQSFDPQPKPAENFDGNDVLTNAAANFRSADSAGAAEGWFRSSSVANNQTLFASSDTGTATSFLHIYIASTTGRITISTQDNVGQVNTQSGTTNVCNGKWFHWKVNSSGTAWDIDYNGSAEAIIDVAGDNTGDWFADITLRDNITIGALTDNGGAQDFAIAVIGWTRIYSRTMASAEARTNYSLGRNAPASNTTGLVYNLPMTEGVGNPVDDVGSLTMIVTGATWITDNQFYSFDSNRHLITNLGATWGKYGRTLNGSTDLIQVPDSASITDIFTGGGTVICWVNPASDGEADNGFIVRKGSGWQLSVVLEAANKVKVRFTKNFDGGDGSWTTTATVLTLDTFEMVAVTYNDGDTSNNPIIYIGNTVLTEGSGIDASNPIGTTVSDSGSDMFIGSNAAPSIRTFDGIIGEGILYKARILSAGDILRHRQNTKWRFES